MLSASRIGLRQSSRVLTEEASLVRVGRLHHRIQRGREIAAAVLAGQGSRYEASPRNIACLTLAMQANSIAKGENNFIGFFSVDDPNGHLYQWLDTNKNVYLRSSTLMPQYHRQQIDGHMNMPRGIDIPQGMGGLMGGMRSLEYFAVPESIGEGRRLFLRADDHVGSSSGISKEDAEQSRALGMQTRKSS